MPDNAVMSVPASKIAESPLAVSLYETDFYSWTRDQAAALRSRDPAAIDWNNVIEEIESLGSEQRGKWTNTAARAIEHMLKIEHWVGASASDLRKWIVEIQNWRGQMADTIHDNPGLQGQYGEMLRLAWQRGRRLAITALVADGVEREGEPRRKLLNRAWKQRLPEQCPWALGEMAAYDPHPAYSRVRCRHPEPDPEVWPPPVARRLNEALGAGYPEGRPRNTRNRGWSH